ncbi:uncharacterized protein PgNI_08553 [Pyricularia grisea]|uniref:Uncharacterized protein n=1 Tax=Pyricularia grisea TaxID=148305 RepID=A0A6P8AUS8_PYRGI|nr:uncharacterized protein PgNI_08553 [Pyricularia grisea]TLD05976.1 hypothetical protein PgNI_08553 [Pyricularia grisea]
MSSPYNRGGSGPGQGSSPGFPADHPLHFGSPMRPGPFSSGSGLPGPGPRALPPLSGFAHLYPPAIPDGGSTASGPNIMGGQYGGGAFIRNNQSDWSPMESHGASAMERRSLMSSSPRPNAASIGTASGSSRYWEARNPQLQPHSRAYEHLYRPALYDGLGPQAQVEAARHFTPSYLRGSTYAKRLDETHKAKLAALKEGSSNAVMSKHAGGPVPGTTNGSILRPGGRGGPGVTGFGPGAPGDPSVYHGDQVNKSRPPSHLGIAYNVTERPSVAPEETDGINPLPTEWNGNDKYGNLEVVADGCEVKLSGPRVSPDRERDHEAFVIRADHYMPPECGIYYYEVTILASKREECTIAVGFSGKHVSMARAPGWEPESWGYHGDDGRSFATSNVGKDYGPKYGIGDVIGCGVNFRTGTAFFTKNGQNLGTAFREIKGKLYPVVGLRKIGDHVRTNFGQAPFVFAIDVLMESERRRIREEIELAKPAEISGMAETEFIQQLVIQFLQHDGYIESARAFNQETRAEKNALALKSEDTVEITDIADDEDAINRQRIRKAILEGDIDQALKYTKKYYPQVLAENENVYFRLRCRKFIEMVLKEATQTLEAEKRYSNGSSNGVSDHQDMDMDDGAALGTEDEDMDGEDGTDNASGVPKTVAYGQQLQAEFKDDPRREVKKTLEEIFALVAYKDPLQSKEMAHLLDKKGRVAVAEELNSAILLSLGKHERAALETLWAQTTVLLEDIREDGGPGAFVAISDYTDQIPANP